MKGHGLRFLFGFLFSLTCWPPAEGRGATPLQITNYSWSASGFQLGWTAQGTGVGYTVQARDLLGNGLWLPAPADQPWPTPFPQWTDAAASNGAACFYRVLAVPAAERGKLLSFSAPVVIPTNVIAATLASAGVPISPQYALMRYEVVYETINPDGGRTKASGMLLFPMGTGRTLPLLSHQHGTIVRTNDVSGSSELTVCLGFGTTGYAAAFPYYLGLGNSEGLHPYHHARSEATACVDLLRAVRTLCATNGFPLNGQVFLCGYSQGGHATMALLRELEAFHTNEFTVTACAPMAGAYDLSGVTVADFLSGRLPPNPYYFAYLLAAYQAVYHLAPTLADLLAPPYNTTLPPLLQGNASGSQINPLMPADPVQILKPEYLAAFRADPHHPFRVALQDNDLYRWTPRAPLRLYHCHADQDVIYANSEVALSSFQSRGATQVQLIDPLPSANHGGCVLPSLLQAKAWFDSLRQ